MRKSVHHLVTQLLPHSTDISNWSLCSIVQYQR